MQNVQVVAADGIVDHTLCLARAEARDTRVNQIGRLGVRLEQRAAAVLVFPLLSPFYNVPVDLLSERLAALQSDDAELSDRNRFKITFISGLEFHALILRKMYFCTPLFYHKNRAGQVF